MKSDGAGERQPRPARPFIFGFAALLGLFVLLTVIVNTPLSRPFVQAGLRAWVHPDLSIRGSVSVGLFPSLRVSIKDLTIDDRAGHLPMVEVGSLDWKLSWASLWSDQLALSEVAIADVTAYRPGAQWDSLRPLFAGRDAGRSTRLRDSFAQLTSAKPTTRSIRLDGATIERLVVVQRGAPPSLTPLVSLTQMALSLQLHSDASANASPLSGIRGHVNASVGGLTFEEGALDGVLQAWLEQLGLGAEGLITVERAKTDWVVDKGIARLAGLEIVGPWGRFSASSGTVSLETGDVRVPVRAQLTSGISLNTPGLQVRAARTDVDLLLTGKFDSLGIESPVAQTLKRISR